MSFYEPHHNKINNYCEFLMTTSFFTAEFCEVEKGNGNIIQRLKKGDDVTSKALLHIDIHNDKCFVLNTLKTMLIC